MTDIPSLRRPDFFDGQLLTAADLNAVQAYHRELFWLHQRTLHSPGIASGLIVTGGKGDTTVTVAPGYAIDTAGRSVVLDAPRVVDIPVASGAQGAKVSYYLTVAYTPDEQLSATVRAGTCESRGGVRRIEEPTLAWREPGSAVQDIVLCAISVANCKLAGPVDLSLRRSALPDSQPYLYAGHSASKWELWTPDVATPDGSDEPIFGLKTEIDTSEAGFVNIPRYQATVVGNRTVYNPGPGGTDAAAVDGHVQIDAAYPDRFELSMTLPKGDAEVNPEWALKADRLKGLPELNKWAVSWLGVET